MLQSTNRWILPARVGREVGMRAKTISCLVDGKLSGSFSLSTTIEIPGKQGPDSSSNESTEKCPVTGRIRFFGSEHYSRKRHQ